MKIALLTSYFPRPGNPVMGIWALREAQGLARAGAELRVIAPTSWVPPVPALPARARIWRETPAACVLEGVPVEYPRWLYWQVRALSRVQLERPRLLLEPALAEAHGRLRRALLRDRPALIYAHHTSTCGLLAARLGAELAIPFVVSEHALPQLESCARLPAVRALYAEVARGANRLVAVSGEMRGLWERLFPEARVALVYNGADPIPEALLAEPRPDALRGRTIVFCAAALHAGKGVAELLEAFAPLACRDPALRLRVAGDGAERPRLQAQIAALGLEPSVSLLGALPHAEVLRELARSDVFALLSHQEAFSVAYLEAMSAGLPLIWTEATGNREVLRDGVHGFEVPPRDVPAARAALEKLLAGPGLRRQMGEACRALQRRELTWDAHGAKLVDIFSRSIEEGPRTTSRDGARIR